MCYVKNLYILLNIDLLIKGVNCSVELDFY